MLSKDVVSMLLWVESSLLFTLINDLSFLSSDGLSLHNMESWESLVVVWNVDTSIDCSLQSTEGSVTSGGSDETHIEDSLEWSSLFDFILLIHIENFSIDILNSLIEISHTQIS